MRCGLWLPVLWRRVFAGSAVDDVIIGIRGQEPGPILSVFFALIVHSELKRVHPGFPVAFIF